MDPIPLALAAAPPGVHRMPSLEPGLPNGIAQRFKSHHSAAQRYLPYLPHALQANANESNEPPNGGTCPSRCSEFPSPMDPIPLALAAAPPGVHRTPSFEPRLPSGRAQRFKSHQSAAQRFSPYLPHALQANKSKKGNEPPKGRTCPSQCSGFPFPMDPIPLALAAAPPGVHRTASLEPKLPIGEAPRFKSHQAAAQRFSPYLPHALQADESKKRQ